MSKHESRVSKIFFSEPFHALNYEFLSSNNTKLLQSLFTMKKCIWYGLSYSTPTGLIKLIMNHHSLDHIRQITHCCTKNQKTYVNCDSSSENQGVADLKLLIWRALIIIDMYIVYVYTMYSVVGWSPQSSSLATVPAGCNDILDYI